MMVSTRCSNRKPDNSRCNLPTNKGFALWLDLPDGRTVEAEIPFCSECAVEMAQKIIATNRMRRMEGTNGAFFGAAQEVHPRGCGCTDCCIGASVPEERAEMTEVDMTRNPGFRAALRGK